MGSIGSMPTGRDVVDLAEGFVAGDGDGTGEVEGAQGLGVKAGEGEAVGVADGPVEPIGAAMALIAEEEAVAGGKRGIPKGTLGMGGEEPEAPRRIRVLAESVEGRMDMIVQLLPIIHAGAAEVAIVEGKSEGFDEVEGSS